MSQDFNITFDPALDINNSTKTPETKGNKKQPFSDQDVLMLAFLFLLEAATINSRRTKLEAKSLQGNAEAQENENREEAQLRFHSIPKRIVDHHVKHYLKWYPPSWTNNFNPDDFRWVADRWNTYPNAAARAQAEAKNQETAAMRQILNAKLTVLQQEASIGMAHINAQSDETVQIMQEGSHLMTIVDQLTFKALLRQPPQ